MIKLNLGCGIDVREGYVNVDSFKLRGVDVVCDLNEYPWPFKNNQFEEVLAYQILEHLDDIPKALREIHRISKNGTLVEIGVPYFASPGAWTDLTHKHPFGYNSLDYMCNNITDKNSSGYYHTHEYGEEKFKMIHREFIFGRLFSLLGIKWFADNLPNYYEPFLSYIFMCRHIEFTIEVVK